MLLMVVLRRYLPYILALAVILGMGFWIHGKGYRSGVAETVAKYEQQIQKERERLVAANKAALDSAKQREAELRKLLSERNVTVRQLLQEAVSDPGAGNVAVSADSVRRINRIR